jgi:hypothetical protein
LSFFFHKYITIEVRDSQTDFLLFHTSRAQITSQENELKSTSLGEIKLNWKAIAWRDEKDPKYPEGATKPPESETMKLTKKLVKESPKLPKNPF